MTVRRVRLRVGERAFADTLAFYDRLGLPVDGGDVAVGETRLSLAAAPGEPFYHFALLAPGDRFEAALAWARARIELLREPDPVFDFSNWGAQAFYFHDPAGNIVEVIAHRGVGERGGAGAFRAEELVGVSELGLVGDVPELHRALAGAGLELWDGEADAPGSLAFVGEKARTLILCPAGRGWLPTGRPAEPHPAEVELSGPPAEVRVGGHVVRRG